MQLLTEKKLNSLNSTQLRAEYNNLAMEAMRLENRVHDNDYVFSRVEKLVEDFSARNFKKSGKGPKKFLFWVILNADEVYNLVVTIISLIKTLKKKYQAEAESYSVGYLANDEVDMEVSNTFPLLSDGVDSQSV